MTTFFDKLLDPLRGLKDRDLAALDRRVEEMQASVEGQVVEQMLRNDLRARETDLLRVEVERNGYLALAFKMREAINKARDLIAQNKGPAASNVLLDATYAGTLPHPHYVAEGPQVIKVEFDQGSEAFRRTTIATALTPEVAEQIAGRLS